MNYRSTNPEGHVHFGGDVMSGAFSTRGVLLSSNTVQAVSDNSNEDLVVKGKGTGKVLLGNSTAGVSNITVGSASPPTVALAASALVTSTITIPGLALGDVFLISRPVGGVSTALGLVGSWASAADEGSFSVINNQASTQSIQSTCVFPYVYIKA